MFKLAYYSNDIDQYFIITAPLDERKVVLFVTKIDAQGVREDISETFTSEEMDEIKKFPVKRICPSNFITFDDAKAKLESIIISDDTKLIIH